MALNKKKTIKTKNVSALPKKSDFSDLDNAVSELAKQTEALLGKTGERMSKPTIPKKKPKTMPSTNSKARSFDIIHNPAANKRTEALLKAPHPGQKLLEAEEDNESPIAVSKAAPTGASQETDSVATVSAHSPGALKFVEAKTIDSDTDSNDSPDSKVEKSTNTKPGKDNDINPDKLEHSDKPAEAETENLEELKTDSPEVVVADKVEVPETEDNKPSVVVDENEDLKPDDKESLSVDPVKNDSVEVSKTDPSQKVQLYSDNLTDAIKSDDEEESGPAIFDTDEYHPTLHDWSKLEHQSSAPKFILLLLLVLLAGGVFVVVSGIQLPFFAK